MCKNRILLSLALLVSAHPLWAQEVPEDDEAQQISGELTLGLGVLSDHSYRFGRYNGIVDQGVAPLFSLRLQTQPVWESDDPRYAWLNINYLGTDSVIAEGEVGVVGRQKASAEFRRLSNYLFRETVTPFNGNQNLTLPGTWQVSGNTTQDFVNVNAALDSSSLQTQRERWQFQFENVFLPGEFIDNGWDFNIAYRHETKQGRRALAGTIGTSAGNARAALFAAPVDFETNILELAVQKSAADFQYGLQYSGSYFTNDVEDVRWQNPFGAVGQWAGGVAFPDGVGQMAREPDNTAQQLGVNASWYFNKSSLHLDASRGLMTQEQRFLPFTANPSLTVTVPLPNNDLDGEVDTTYVNIRYAMRPLTKLNLVARYRLDDRDNTTPQYTYYIVSGDAADQNTVDDARVNRPYSYTKETFAVDANYRLSRGLRLKFGADRENYDRNYSEVDKTQENTLRAGLLINAWQNVNLSVNVASADRDSDTYVGNRPLLATHVPGTVAPTDFENHPQLRKYYLSDRERRQLQIRADWFVGAASFGFSAAYNRDQYDDDFFGLQEATLLSLALDAGYQINDRLNLTAFLARDAYDTEQAGRSFTAAPGQYLDPARDWNVSGDDSFDNAGLTVEWQDLPLTFPWLPQSWRGTVDTGLELLYSRSQSDIDTSTGPALMLTPLPAIETRLKSYRWYLRWHLPDNARMDFSLTHESYQTDDFAYTDVGPITIANVLTLGEANPYYSVNWVTLSYTLPF